jgi:2-polyprenyl-3-methyl-5-hydroxy-6-metoxy-1,4-benzoquinol methylase
MDLRASFGNIDVYLFDQLLRGNIAPGMRIFDAGCGSGRNLVYFLNEGFDVSGIDVDAEAIESTRRIARLHVPPGEHERFRVGALESNTRSECADVVICNAVLHFARDHDHFDAMLDGAWRALAAGGLFFARLASSIGIEDALVPLGAGRHGLPDGTQRYLVDLQGLRCMTTWAVRKPARSITG